MMTRMRYQMPIPPDDVFLVEGKIVQIYTIVDVEFSLLEIERQKYFIQDSKRKFRIGQKIKAYCIPDKLKMKDIVADIAFPVSEIELVK